MKNVLIISGHTNLTNDSVANKTIIEELRKAHPEYQFNVLSEAYPNYVFDVEAEQEKLRRADVIVFSSPYSGIACLHYCANGLKMWWFTALPMAQRALLYKERNSLHPLPQADQPRLTPQKALWATPSNRFWTRN